MERRGFFKRALAFLGIASAAPAAVPASSGLFGFRVNFPEDSDAGNQLFDQSSRDELDREITKLRFVLACVSITANGEEFPGGLTPENNRDLVIFPTYQDVLSLRRKFEVAVKLLADSMPITKMAVLYPCGCSATGHSPILDSASLPLYCPDHGDHEHPNGHTILGMRPLNVIPLQPIRGGNLGTFDLP